MPDYKISYDSLRKGVQPLYSVPDGMNAYAYCPITKLWKADLPKPIYVTTYEFEYQGPIRSDSITKTPGFYEVLEEELERLMDKYRRSYSDPPYLVTVPMRYLPREITREGRLYSYAEIGFLLYS